ncbi:MAG: heparinase II/III family protein [Rhodospirillaceae bacterium]|nr:heparinase II/III family protein [Rhodospirillaceae bacterium]MDE0618642.1 heparinase II/III family protein [Rhodospirillaceae bacterium]
MARGYSISVRRGVESLRMHLAGAWYRSALYQWRLGGTRATQVLLVPHDPWPGDSEVGKAILRGAFNFRNDRIWRGEELPLEPHDFAWLRDLRATGSDAGRRLGRELMSDWIDRFGRYHHHGWRADIAAERLINWLSQYDYFCRGAEDRFRDRVLQSVHRQARHLSNVTRKTTRGARRVRAAKGLIYVGACLPSAHARLFRGLTLLEHEIEHRIHADGGVAERCPTLQHEILRDLIDVRSVLASSHQDASPVVQGAIDRAAPMLRGMRLGDGALAVFNGSFEEQDWQIDMTLNQSGSTGNPPEHPPHTGFQRVIAGRTMVVMDTGMPPAPGHDDLAHAGLLSFEMSAGRSRLIVNCGSYWKRNSDWAFAGRISAAHSTLVVANRNSSQLHRNGGLGRRPAKVDADRKDLQGAILIEGSHDGYAPAFAVVHRRRLYVSANGEDVRGQDILSRPEQSRRNADVEFAVRFHLHPDVSIDSMSIWEKGGRIIDFSRPGAGSWQFHTESGVTIGVEDSFYQGMRNERQRTRQIVLSGEYRGAEPRSVRWAIRRR